MKKFPKILTIIFLSFIIIQTGIFLFINFSPESGQAAVSFKPQVSIGNFEKGESKLITSSSIGQYIQAVYKYAIGIVGILAAAVLMLGGFIWLTAGGSAEKITSAKAWIGAALTGLVLALSSYMILSIINPALVNFEPVPVSKVTDISVGCCEADTCTANISKTSCEAKKGYIGWKEGEYSCSNNKCAPIKGCCLVIRKKSGDYKCTITTVNDCQEYDRSEESRIFEKNKQCADDGTYKWGIITYLKKKCE